MIRVRVEALEPEGKMMRVAVTLKYRCKLCGSPYVKHTDGDKLPDNPLLLMQAVGLTRHSCPDGAVGIAELEGYHAEAVDD